MTEQLSGLTTWIQRHHLDDDALADARARFSSSPVRTIVLQDVLPDDLAQRLTTFLSQEAEFRREYGLTGRSGPVSEAEWEAAQEDDRFFRLSRLAGTAPEHQFSPNAMAYVRLRSAFAGEEVKGFFEQATGLRLAPSEDFGVHSMQAGDFLTDHSDDQGDRQLALVLYLSPGWTPEYGGRLSIRHRDGATLQVDPVHNSMVVFDVLADTVHRVEPVLPAAGAWRRLTIGGWYHRRRGDAAADGA